MFVDFLFELRRQGLKVSTHEWNTLLEGLALGLHEASLDGFYRLARAICVKDITELDLFDVAFLAYFKDVHLDAAALTGDLMEWLRHAREFGGLTEEQRKMLEALDLEKLREMFEERLREQKKRHDGGNRWIGTGGRSPFGRGGEHPSGIRLGEGGGRSAMQVASERRFREYRRDMVLDVRQIDMALRGLRRLGRDGAIAELDIDQTVDETCKNAGELEIVFQPPRRNRMKVVLLMDVGGSMDPYAELVSQLFTAASRTGRFSRFRSYYFHNCVYDKVYEDARLREGVLVSDLLNTSDREERLVVVGDALMHPAELLEMGGSIYYYSHNATPGIEWLRRLSHHFRHSAWLNPEPRRYWPRTTIEYVASVFAMYELTLEGLDEAVRYLVRGGERPAAVA
ncbi:MAG TPA: VWA domain-containing protein [Kofleriaceae bacterium]|nr:VWA domain-containing protein [Kofleriaceae bacterium]